ncbi:class II aldolase/adducin family protein [Methylophilaceae bacterium]|jgi:L-fuculose-phosphate aldolase|nr:class II aldolase/adducin family protein [Methylophilaceae bacterium]|tara:strand:- start:1147 stop:1800 length:654 start_codon:yes stop_codon:yes gene_type:complete
MSKKTKLTSIVEAAIYLEQIGLNHGATGNCSCRDGDTYLITPSGIETQNLSEDKIVRMNFSGNIVDSISNLKPSSEWRFHQDIMSQRKEVGAVVHTHSIYASTVSLFGSELPPFHYMIAVAGGDSVRCAPYAMFGTQELSDNIINALIDRKACLIANHGLVAIGDNLKEALEIAEEIEHLSQLYIEARKLGEPNLLSKKQMSEVIERFQTYSRWTKV